IIVPMKHFLTSLILLSLVASRSVLAASFTMDYGAHGSSTLTSPTLVPATNVNVFTYYGFPVTNYSGTTESAAGIANNATTPDFQPIQVAFDVTGTNCELVVNDLRYPANTQKVSYWYLTDGNTTSDYHVSSIGNGAYSTTYIPVTFPTNG